MTAAPENLLPLSAHELLTTTRAVRKRLDFDRPVPRQLIADCIADALQAPSASNSWTLRFIAVDDPELRGQIGEIYREAFTGYQASRGYISKIDKGSVERNAQQQRSATSAEYLGEHLAEAPVLVIGALAGRTENPKSLRSFLASGMPGMWSFMLAARLRGLGTAWTTLHLQQEECFHEVLGIPADVTTFCLTPVAYTKGTDFAPALRPDPDEVLSWNGWH